MKPITAEVVLRLMVRTALHFLKFAWETLGEKKIVINVKED